MRLPVLRPVVVGAAAAVAAGLVAYLPTAASAAEPAPSTPLYLHSANGSYAFDYALDPGFGAAPEGATLSTAEPTSDAAASATTYGVGLRGSATLPYFSIPVSGDVSSLCVDIWAAPDGSGNVIGEATLALALDHPDLAAPIDLEPVVAPYPGGIVRVSGVVDVPAGTTLPEGGTLQVAGAYSDDPTDIFYDSVDMPSSITFNPTGVCGDPTAPPPPGGGAVAGSDTYTSYTPPTTFGQAAAEPSVGFSEKTGSVFMQGGYDTMRIRFDDSVTPAAATWNRSADQLLTQITSLDPIGYVDRETGRVFASQLIGACSLTEFNDGDGEGAWTPSQGCGLPHGVDHQTIGGGNFGPGGTSTNGYPNAVWYCSQELVTGLCALSRDGGETFGQGTPISTILDCAGLHGHVRVGPDGTAYVPNAGCNGQVGINVQKDGTNQTPWTTMLVPDSTTQSESDPSVDVDPAGKMFVGYGDGDGHPKIATYDTVTGTWTPSVDVGAPFGLQNMQFGDVITGDAGRAAFSFLGTTTPGDDQAAAFAGTWHLYVATTTDGGATWRTVNATPGDPVQRGCIWLGGGNNACRNLLDFNDITIDDQGRVLVAIADGCINLCVTNPAQNTRANRATLVRQTTGLTLRAAYDPAPILGTTTTYTGETLVRSGGELPVSATLRASDGSVPAGAQVRFTLGGNDVTVPVDAAGVATAVLPAGAGQLTAAFLGLDGFGPSSNKVGISTYDVRLTPSLPTATPVSGTAGTVTVTATRTDTGAVDSSWTGTPVLTTTDTHPGGLSCSAAVGGTATCSAALGDLGPQSLTVSAPGGYLSGSTTVTVQPTGLRFVTAPAVAKSGTATTYTVAPTAGVTGALLDGYAAVQALSSNGKGDSVPPPQSCTGATCNLTVTFGKTGGTRTLTVQDTSTPSRAATTSTAVRG